MSKISPSLIRDFVTAKLGYYYPMDMKGLRGRDPLACFSGLDPDAHLAVIPLEDKSPLSREDRIVDLRVAYGYPFQECAGQWGHAGHLFQENFLFVSDRKNDDRVGPEQFSHDMRLLAKNWQCERVVIASLKDNTCRLPNQPDTPPLSVPNVTRKNCLERIIIFGRYGTTENHEFRITGLYECKAEGDPSGFDLLKEQATGSL